MTKQPPSTTDRELSEKSTSNSEQSPKTLYQKLWDSHVVKTFEDDSALIYIDRHLVQEVTSPVAFASLRERGIKVRRPDKTLSVVDHVVPTQNRHLVEDPMARAQIQAIEKNSGANHIAFIPVTDVRQGIAHVVGPEQGFTLPGTTVVCGDSHTATHGAFGAIAFGIGTSECEKVFATQCLKQRKAKTMRVTFSGTLGHLVSAKDLALAVIAKIGASGGSGYAIEYAGEVVQSLSMEARMTLCNMTIEAGARVGLIAPDDTTFSYLEGRPYAPKGDDWKEAVQHWRQLHSDKGAVFDQEIKIQVDKLSPMVTWGTSPEHVVSISDAVPWLSSAKNDSVKASWHKAMRYMQLSENTSILGTPLDQVFIGSCTNSRIEDLRIAAKVVAGKRVSDKVKAMVVPGSGLVKQQAEKEGLDQIFLEAGFEWRTAGCSMCVAMNNDRLAPGQRCASTSNRNFEGRQGKGGKTHLMSPAMAAAAAVTGQITDVRGMI